MKKVLSLVLVIAMVLSSMSFAFAGTFTDVTGDYEDAINTLAGLGVVTGYEDGTYKPERVVTRAEMAKLLVEILGYGDLVAGSKSNFTDTQGHWADAWIALAAGKGIVVGTGEGKFTPDRTVSYDEAITMVVRGLGYTDNCNELKGMTWPTNFKVKAAELDLLDGVKLATAGADRGGVAQLLYNALEATLVTVTSDGDVTLLFNTVDGEKVDRILLSRLAYEDTVDPVTPDHLDEDDKDYLGDIVDLTPYMYQKIVAYFNSDDEVVYVKDVKSVVIVGTVTDYEDEVLTVEDADENEYEISTTATGIKTYFNGVENEKDAADLVDAEVTVIIDDVNNNDKFDKAKDKLDAVVATKATDEIRVSKEYVDGRTKFSGITLPKDDDDDVNLDKVVVEGAVDAIEDIVEDSIVTVYTGAEDDGDVKNVRLVVSTDTVEGKVAKANYDKSVVTVAGKGYDASLLAKKTTVVVGETGTLYLNAKGEYFEFVSEDEDEVGDYAVVVSRSNGEYDAFLEANTKDAKVKLATAADKEIIYSFAEEAEINGVELEANASDVLDVVSKLAVGKVVEYTLDDDGKIESIEYVAFKSANIGKALATDTKAFIVADNVVIFDGQTADKYQVLSVDQLDDDIVADVLYNDDDEIELLFVTDGVEAETTGTYAIINNVEVSLNDDDDTVYLITAFVDGEKVTYFTDEDFYKANPSASTLRTALRGGYKLNELVLDGNVITDVVTEGAFDATEVVLVQGNVKSVKAASDVITLADGTVIVLADEAIVYLQTGAATVVVEDINEIDADDLATTSKTEGDTIKALDTDDDGEFDIVIIKER